MADEVVICRRDCPLYHDFNQASDLCKARIDEEMSYPFCYSTTQLKQPCKYGLTERGIREIVDGRKVDHGVQDELFV